MAKRTNKKSNLAVAYQRVSTEDQINGPKAQADAIEKYARANGLRVLETHSEVISGGADLVDRKVLFAAIDRAKVLGASVLLIAKRDRLARDSFVAAFIERELSKVGIRIESADGAANGDTPEAKLLRGILASFADFERQMVGVRTKNALAARKRRNLRGPGDVPYRFRVNGESIERDPTEMEVVRTILAARESGSSYQAIVNALNLASVPARGTKWHVKTLQRVVARETAVESKAA